MASDSDELPSEEELEEDEDSEEGSEDGSEGEESEEDEDEEERPKKRHKKAELPPPGREMPQRATRGQRMGALVKDAEEEEADQAFWNQEFFAEEAADEQYVTESEPEDVADADFSESEEEDEDEGDAEAEAQRREPKKKTLKPPGYKKPPLPPKPKPPGGAAASGQKAGAPRKRAPSADSDMVFERRTVRESTRQKVAEAEEERKLQEAIKPRRQYRQTVARVLTQAELLAEAAKTEIENTRSLQYLVALEEQTKKKAEVKKKKYAGPMTRFLSRAVEGVERSTLEVRNMQTPPELLPKSAPPPPPKPVCVVTGLPARYIDPKTKQPYANLQAYKVLQQQYAAAQAAQAAAAQARAYAGAGGQFQYAMPAAAQQVPGAGQQVQQQFQYMPPAAAAVAGQQWQGALQLGQPPGGYAG